MALCDFLITRDIEAQDCSNPMVKGASNSGLLMNRADITYSVAVGHDFRVYINLKCGEKRAYQVSQSGKQPWNGTQQEMVEGAYANTITNTVQLVVLKHDGDTAQQLFSLVNGEFVAVIPNKNGTYQVYGLEAGLHCTGAVRELYNDDTLSGWLITFTEEGASKGNYFMLKSSYNNLHTIISAPCT